MSLYSASKKKLNYLSMLMDSNVNQYPSCALCPLSPHQWNCAQIPILTSHLCFQLALLFLLPGCKRSMLRNAPELLWDGLFISGIHSRISWENGSAFRADPQRRHSSTGLLPQGPYSPFTPLSWCFPANVSFLLERIIQLPGVVNSKWIYAHCS